MHPLCWVPNVKPASLADPSIAFNISPDWAFSQCPFSCHVKTDVISTFHSQSWARQCCQTDRRGVSDASLLLQGQRPESGVYDSFTEVEGQTYSVLVRGHLLVLLYCLT
jgi:hypothetical protein